MRGKCSELEEKRRCSSGFQSNGGLLSTGLDCRRVEAAPSNYIGLDWITLDCNKVKLGNQLNSDEESSFAA